MASSENLTEEISSPLLWACKTGNTQKVSEILFTNVDQEDNQIISCLEVAVSEKHLDIVELFLTNDSIKDIITDSYEYGTLIMNYIQTDNKTLFDIFIDASTMETLQNLEIGGISILHEAVFYNRIGMVEKLINKNFPINCKDQYGNTPLLRLFQNKTINAEEKAMFQFLIKHGADCKAKNNQGKNCLFLYIKRQGRDVDVINKLVECGCEINERDNYGETVLFDLCERIVGSQENARLVKYFLDLGADDKIINIDQKTCWNTINIYTGINKYIMGLDRQKGLEYLEYQLSAKKVENIPEWLKENMGLTGLLGAVGSLGSTGSVGLTGCIGPIGCRTDRRIYN